jgi:peptidyl-prolyl cis-trans isomerase D
MLHLMRRSANSWLIIFFFGAIIFVFAINGPWSWNLQGSTPYAADVNGRVITLPEFQSAYGMIFRSMQNYRADFTHEQAEKEGLRTIVLNQLLTKELLAQLAERHGLSISDEELAKFIRDNMFGKDQVFDREAYKQAVWSNFHTTESQFESQIRREMLANRMGDLISNGGKRARLLQSYAEFLKKNASIKYNPALTGNS